MRTVVYFDEKKNQVMAVHQRLSKQPDGNAQQRAKAMRSGWKPEWIPCERPYPLENYESLASEDVIVLPFGELESPPEIAEALSIAQNIVIDEIEAL